MTRPPTSHAALPLVLLRTERFAALHGARLVADHPDLRLEPVTPGVTPIGGALDGVEVAFASPDLHPDGVDSFVRLAATAPRLRWLQMFAAGLDYPALQLLRDNGVRITSASGATAAAIARTVVFYLLALSRDARRLFAEQAATIEVLVLALPLTPGTQEICSAEVIASMKAGALLVNVGRGALSTSPPSRVPSRAARSAGPASTCSSPSRSPVTARCGTCPT